MQQLKLLLAAIIWGVTFVVIGDAMTEWNRPFTFMSMRFALAGALFLPFIFLRAGGRRSEVNQYWKPAFISGGLLFIAFSAQTHALGEISPVNAAFYFTLAALLVPVGAWKFFGDRITRVTWAGVALAALGLTMVLNRVQLGDINGIASAVLFAAYLLAVSRYARKKIHDFHAPTFTGLCLLVVAALSTVASLATEFRGIEMPTAALWRDLAYAVVFASCAAFFLLTSAAKHVSATQTALILAIEPVIATLATWAWVQYKPNQDWAPPTPTQLVGFGLIFFGALLVELHGAAMAQRKASPPPALAAIEEAC